MDTSDGQNGASKDDNKVQLFIYYNSYYLILILTSFVFIW
jgi:hypothetical protein